MPAPNKWNLAGGGISVHYTTLGGGHFHFQNGSTNLNFAGPQIRVVPNPDLGTLVSVTVHLTIDSGSTTFTVLLPVVEVDGTHPVEPVHTDGITTLHRLLPGLGQKEFYTVTALAGSASL
jgi:hypothetical protein